MKHALSGEWTRLCFDHESGKYKEDSDREPFTGVIVGVRADEERVIRPGDEVVFYPSEKRSRVK